MAFDYSKWFDKETSAEVSDYYLRMQHRKSYALAQIQNEWWDK
ncbi:hypothetical protein [Colwellia sp. RSH04]|nr:hypothetical protein [Colwellia sp. RSH04]